MRLGAATAEDVREFCRHFEVYWANVAEFGWRFERWPAEKLRYERERAAYEKATGRSNGRAA